MQTGSIFSKVIKYINIKVSIVYLNSGNYNGNDKTNLKINSY